MKCLSLQRYDEVFVNDDDFITNYRKGQQFMILDIGCPRSLMGNQEYEKLKKSLSNSELSKILEFSSKEKFRFGPSKIFESLMRIELPLNIEEAEFDAKFFVINGDIPILIGNDILEPLGGVIDIDERFIEFKKLNCTVDIFKTKGGHYVVPVTKRRKNIDENQEESDVLKEKPDD